MITYVITVTNYGPSVSTNAIVSDTFTPSGGVTYVSTNATQGSVIRSGSDFVWNIGTLAVNAGAQLTVVVKVTGVAAGGTLDNTATASAGTVDPNPADDSANLQVSVNYPQPPQITSTVFANSNGTFRISVADPDVTTPSMVIQASSNLLNWVNVYTSTPPYTYVDSTATNYPRRFYRVVLMP